MLRKLWLILLLSFCSSLLHAQSTLSQQDKAALAQLADVLDNPQQRKVLIEQLRAITETNQPATEKKETDSISKDTEESGVVTALSSLAGTPLTEKSDAKAEDSSETQKAEANEDPIAKVTENTKAAISQAVSLPRKLADASAKVATQVSDRIKHNWQAVKNIFAGKDYRLSNINWDTFLNAVKNLGIVILAMLSLYHGLRAITRPIRSRLNEWSLHYHWSNPLIRKIIAILGIVAMDSIFVGITYTVGNLLALYAIGQYGALSTQASLFIFAFVVIEFLKIGLRTVFLTRFPGLRLLTSDNGVTRFWYRWFASLINWLGYGYLTVIPLIETYLSYSLAQAVSTIIAIGAFVYGVWVIIRKRKGVHDALVRVSERTEQTISKIFMRILAVTWHWLALAYFLMLLVVTLLRAEKSLPFVMKGTLKTLLIVGAGLLLSSLITNFLSRRIRLPENWSRSMPSIERQLNAYVPFALRVIRFILLVVVVLSILSAWNLINLSAWAASPSGQAFIDRWLGAGLILFFCALVWLICCGIIENRLSPDTGTGRPSARAETLLSLIKNAFAIIIAAVCTMMFLSQIGINIGPLIAGAGVLGLAVGFGAQTLVKDVITGIFIQIENAMNTGDFVTVDGISGTAERISIRSVSLRDTAGTYHIIPFSSVTTVSNYMRGFAYHTAEYGISYNDDIDYACEQLQAAFDELAKGEHKRSLLEPILIQGVSSLGDSSVNIRIRIKTLPGEQWAIGRAYNRLVKLYFDRAGIEIPYPHQTLYFGENKDGSAPPLNIRKLKEYPISEEAHTPTLEKTTDNAQKNEKKEEIPPVPKILKDQHSEDSTPDVGGNL